MRRLLVLILMALVIVQVHAQSLCDDDVIENFTADIQFSAMQVEMEWDFNYPFNCGAIGCPPGIVPYEVEFEFGIKPGPSLPIIWFSSGSLNFTRDDTLSEHAVTISIPSKFEYFRYRVKVDLPDTECNNWFGWHEASIWD